MPISNLLNHPGFKKYFANTSWLFVGKIIQMIVGLFVGVYVARYLGPSQFGLLSYAIAFVGLFSAIASLGLDSIVVRELVKTPQKLNELLGTAFFLKIIGAVLMFGAIIIGTQFSGNDDFTNLLVIIIASGYIFQAFSVIDLNFQATVKSRYVVRAQIIQLFISSGISLFLIWIGASLLWFAIVGIISAVVLASSLVWNYLQSGGRMFAWKFKLATAKALLKDSWPLILAGVSLMIQARIDQVMLKQMIGDSEVGYYSVALRFIEAVAFVPIVLRSSLSPAIINAKKISQNLYQHRLLNFYRLNFLLFLVVAIPIYFFAEKIVVLLLGAAYQPAGILLSLMAIRLFFANMGVARGQFILVENLFKYSLITMVLGTITNVLLNYFLIPDYKSIGAIIATVISFFVTVFAVDIFYNKTRKNTLTIFKAIGTFYKVRF